MRTKLTIVVIATVAACAIWYYGPRTSPDAAATPYQSTPAESAAKNHSDALPFGAIEALEDLLRVNRPAGRFWHRDAISEARRIEQMLDAEHKARAALIERFGPQVVQAPAFWQLFRPLHTRMPHLTSDEQIVIHTLERRFTADSLRSDDAVSFHEHLARIADRLGADTAAQYALHTSPLAEELRSLGIDFSELTFREAFAALSRLSGSPDTDAFIAARRLLRKLLGDRHFARLWSTRDPRYRQFSSVATRYELTHDTLLSAYSLLLENEAAMLDIAVTPHAPDQQRRLREQHDRGRRRLQELVGTQAADALLHAAAPME